jgi:hypothetical protein
MAPKTDKPGVPHVQCQHNYRQTAYGCWIPVLSELLQLRGCYVDISQGVAKIELNNPGALDNDTDLQATCDRMEVAREHMHTAQERLKAFAQEMKDHLNESQIGKCQVAMLSDKACRANSVYLVGMKYRAYRLNIERALRHNTMTRRLEAACRKNLSCLLAEAWAIETATAETPNKRRCSICNMLPSCQGAQALPQLFHKHTFNQQFDTFKGSVYISNLAAM